MPRLKTTADILQQERRKVTRKIAREAGKEDPYKKERVTRFIGVDGEGITIGREHRYVLLGVGKEQIINGGGLRFDTICQFLYEQYERNPDATFVGFFLGYDFTQWFKTLPYDRGRILLTESGRLSRQRRNSDGNHTPFPVGYGKWEFDILGFKRFRLREKGKKGWMYINDAGSFFQTSFLAAIDPEKWIDPVVSEEEYATIKAGKEKRSSARLDSDMQFYNVLENVVLGRLMARLDQGFREAGIRLRKDQWFGPGQAAQAWLGLQKEVPSSKTLQESPSMLRHVQDLGRMTYYGGWFEIFAHGHIPGQSWEYDINSAYPYIIAGLPCLLHGRWNHGTGSYNGNGRISDGQRRIRIVRARLVGSNPFIGVALHRLPDGRISRPQQTRGYFWQHELDAAIRAKLIDTIDYEEWWEYEPCNCRPPMRGISGLYNGRLEAGKNTSTGKALKLVYNSMYGKFAQSVGNPKFGNSIYASLTTAGCRTIILDAIASHPMGASGVVMVATDGVYFLEKHPKLTVSEKLGEWTETIHDNLTLFKPGVYWDDKARERIARGNNPVFKARGISAKVFGSELSNIDRHFSTWQGQRQGYPLERDPDGSREGWFPSVKFTTEFSMVSCLQALEWGKWELAGTLGHRERKGDCEGCNGAHLVQDSDPIEKRHSGWYDEEYGIFRSRPYETVGIEDSTPYDRRFGMPDDPDVYGYNPEGYVLDAWKGLLR